MKREYTTSSRSSRQWRWLAVAVALVATLATFAASAFADAGNPILGTIEGQIVPDNPANPNGPVTVYVRGQWNWLSHNSDCNFDRAATGVGIVWNDPNGADRTRTISTAKVDNNGTVTLTTPAHTFTVGDDITVAGVSGGTGYNGTFVISGVSGTTVKYLTNPKATGTGSGGTVTDLDAFNGFKVSKSPISAYVGTRTAAGGNPVDQMVHPVDLGNVPQGYTAGTWRSTAQGYTTNTSGDYPFGQLFTDPSPPNPSSVASWRGGCGREPLTSTGPAGSGGSGNPDFVNAACANGGACAGRPWGSWGYAKNDGQGYSHHFASRADVTTVCANFYDVHGGGKANQSSFQVPNGAKEITVDANGDNSIETNSFNTAQGTNCITFPSTGTPTISTTASAPVTIGGTISDTATISGLVNPDGTGSVTFKAYAPNADGTADTSCSVEVYSNTVTGVTGPGPFNSGGFTPTGVAPQIAGTYEWIASYSGDGKNNPATSPCNAAGEQSVVNKQDSTLPTRQSILITDTAKVTGTGTPTGTVTFQLFTSSDCSSGKVYDSGAVQLVNGLASASNPTPLTVNGTYKWLVSYSGDAANVPATSPCGAEQTSISGNSPNIAP